VTAAPTLRIEIVGRGREGADLPAAGVLRVGSDPERCDLAVRGPGVAAVHCVIGRLKGGGWGIKDLGSRGGTRLNGERCQAARLAAGDELLLGTTRLRIVDPAAPLAPPRSVLPRVAGYRIERRIGRGGMGDVYAAVQQSLQRPVALKVVAADLEADPEFVRRFVAEARAAAALSHPNVVTVYDVGEDRGQHYLSMEYMAGGNLEMHFLLEGPLTVEEAFAVLTDAAKGLVFAELRGIVHRDIKPANLMRDGLGTTKIADLGLATKIEAQSEEDDDRRIFGTPHFISPEQARGERVDCRSDLYSLGATVYRLLSGRTPFEGRTTRDILRGHFLERPRPLGELVPHVPPALVAMVHRLLEKDPADRYPSASALLLDVERLRASRGQAPAAPGPGARPHASWWLAGIAVAALAAVVLVIVSDGDSPVPDRGGAPANATPGAREPNAAVDGGGPGPAAVGGERPDSGAAAEHAAPPEDDDSALKALEARATAARAAIAETLTPLERRDALIELSREYAGTTAAGRWAAELERLAAEAAPDDTRPDSQRAALDALRAAGAPGGTPLALDRALSAMLAVPTPPELAAEPSFRARRGAIFAAVLDAALANGRERAAAVDADAEAGRFEAVAAELEATLASLAGPDPVPVELAGLPQIEQLDALRAELAGRLTHLDRERERFALRQRHRDALAVAAGLGGPQGLGTELEELDFDAALQRLDALATGLETESAREMVARWRAAAAAGRRARDTVVREFQAGGWRRRQLPDPRSPARTSHRAVAVDARGVVLDVAGTEERVPWASFGASPAALNHLFHERLERDYTAAETADVADLLRLAAVVRAARAAAGCLASPTLDESGVDALLEGFDDAVAWGELAGAPEPARRERAAAQAFADALRGAEAGTWSRAVAHLERLFEEFGDTLFVRLLADGSAWKPAPAGE